MFPLYRSLIGDGFYFFCGVYRENLWWFAILWKGVNRLSLMIFLDIIFIFTKIRNFLIILSVLKVLISLK